MVNDFRVISFAAYHACDEGYKKRPSTRLDSSIHW